MAREYSRSERVASLIQRELAALLQTYKGDFKLGIVTISEVVVCRDLSIASVYVTVLGFEGDQLVAQMAGLNDVAPFFRKELGRSLRLRVVPELRFIYDDSIDNGMRMDKLLRNLDTDDA